MYEPFDSVERERTRSWLGRDALEKLDRELVMLAQGVAVIRLGIGDALSALSSAGGLRRLGFSSLDGYARERCEHSGRWARDARALARRLRELPAMRAALLSGELSWSMAELLSRHAEPDGEQALLSEACGKTVRQMRELLRERAAAKRRAKSVALTSPDEDEPEPLVTLSVTVTTEEAWAFECTRMLVEALAGTKSDSAVIDCLLAEGMTTLLGRVPGAADELEHSLSCAPFETAEYGELHRQWQRQLASWRNEAEARCEPRIPPRSAGSQSLAELAPEPDELPTDDLALDGRIVDGSRKLLRRDLELGDGLRRLCDANGWRRLGYASLGQYARERLGVSLSSAKARMSLSRRAAALAQLREAVTAGTIGFEAAMLVGRVATGSTVRAWLERAKARTVKHLGEEVGYAEVLARTSGDAEQPPPDAETLAALMALESHVLSGRIFRSEEAPRVGQMGQVSVDVDASVPASRFVPGQMSVAADEEAAKPRLGAGKVTLKWRVTEDVARAWHALKKLHGRSAFSGSLVELLCAALWQSWSHTLGPEVAYGDIYARDRYRCSSPVCFSRNQTPHHVRFRAHGGDDSPENLTGPCADCHLDGIHGGNVRVSGMAPNLHWQLGRRPILEVSGRERRAIER